MVSASATTQNIVMMASRRHTKCALHRRFRVGRLDRGKRRWTGLQQPVDEHCAKTKDRSVYAAIEDKGAEHFAQYQIRRDRVGRPQDTIRGPRLPADLSREPARQGGEEGQRKTKENRP